MVCFCQMVAKHITAAPPLDATKKIDCVRTHTTLFVRWVPLNEHTPGGGRSASAGKSTMLPTLCLLALPFFEKFCFFPEVCSKQSHVPPATTSSFRYQSHCAVAELMERHQARRIRILCATKRLTYGPNDTLINTASVGYIR